MPNSLPSFIADGPIRILLWLGTLFVIGVLGGHIARRGGETSTGGEIAVSLLSKTIRLLGFSASLLIGAFGLAYLQRLDGVPAAIGYWSLILITFAAAFVGMLFIARQFTAPPWWRLNAWEPTDASDFKIRDAFEWIMHDAREFVFSLRLIDRITILAGVPLLVLNAMAMTSPHAALFGAYVALGVCHVALMVAMFSANRIPRILLTRLQDLRAAAAAIRSGDLGARVPNTGDAEYQELGQLIRDFNSMAESIKTMYIELAEARIHAEAGREAAIEQQSIDSLTGLRNHGYFQNALASELVRSSRTGETTTIAILDLDDFKAVNDTYGHQEGDEVLRRTANALTQILRPYDLPARLGGEEFGVIFPSTSAEDAKLVLDRVMEMLRTAGPNGSSQTFSGGIASFPQHTMSQATLCELADSASYAAKLNGKAHTVIFDSDRVKHTNEDNRMNMRERDAHLRVARTLVATVDTMEGVGNEHSENVGQISAQIASTLGYDDEFAQQMYLCGLLHDVGKIGIDQSLMQKQGQLTPDEYEQIKKHPELSARIVMNAGLGELSSWVRHHHENYDGTGYPEGLAGHDIPLGSRIILVAEAFDVMTSNHPYREAMSAVDAMNEILRGAGTRFDPEVVTALHHLVQHGYVVASAYSAVVRANNPADRISLPSFDPSVATQPGIERRPDAA